MLIYKITNKNNSKSYIGQTRHTFVQRWKQHCKCKKNDNFHNTIRKYGTDCWIFETLETFDSSEPLELLNLREKYWIKYHDTFNNGYNLRLAQEKRNLSYGSL